VSAAARWVFWSATVARRLTVTGGGVRRRQHSTFQLEQPLLWDFRAPKSEHEAKLI